MMTRILVVGAGLAGAVYARSLAERGCDVTVIDSRPHIAGNCFDYTEATGVRVHKYGPHLFHTSNKGVVAWLSQFTDWVDYQHRVVAQLPDGRLTPLPVNLDTVNAVFGKDLRHEAEVAALLGSVSVKKATINNAEDWLYSNIGPELTDLFFRPYTKKMWGHDLTEIEASVVQRISIRTDRNNLYFPNDTFQAMPKDGYTEIFKKIFDHDRIDIKLSTPFEHSMLADYDACFNSMPIDEFFDFELGHLPYRSIRFHVHEEDLTASPEHVTINYTDSGPFTRETWWHNIPNHHTRNTGKVLRTVEEPCDYQDNNMERYYPIKTADGRFDSLYRQYKSKSEEISNLHFIGRCGTYQYLDMHQVINQSLMGAAKWIKERDMKSLDPHFLEA